jgi:transposase
METAALNYEELLAEVALLRLSEAVLKTEVTVVTEQNTLLKQQLEWFQKQLFGSKSERLVDSSQQLILFPEMAPVKKEQEEKPKGKPRTKKVDDKTQITLPADLPIERIEIDLPASEKVCKVTGELLVKIGEEVTRKLAHRPGSFYIKEIVRFKYAAPQGKEAGVQIAPLPGTLLNRCLADESLLASILVSKFGDHLPLYRLSEILSREHIYLSRQLLSDWVVRAGKALYPLYEEMEKRILGGGCIFMDETPLDLQEKGKGSLHQGYMWVMCGGEKAPYQLYRFFRDRKHQNAETLLKDYTGLLHSDNYGAYPKQAEKKTITWQPCWSHIRRKFFEAQTGDPFREWILEKIQSLFLLEREAWESAPEERLRIRQEQEVPIIDGLINQVKEKLITGKLLPKSKLREALGYFCSLIPHLKNYTKHSEARLDNNAAERAIRPLAIGRKNWLFVGSEGGAEAAAVALSLIQSCRSLKINPRDYLEDVMRRLQDHPANKLAELLPDHWATSKQI